MVERHWDCFAEEPWVCTLNSVDWLREGFSAGKLDYLGMQFGWFYDGHQALADCEACLALLAPTLPKSGRRVMSLMQWTFIQAFKVGEAAVIAPVEYARLLYAAVIGIVVLPRIRPHGLSVVRGSSSRVRCFTLHRNALKKRQKAPDGP